MILGKFQLVEFPQSVDPVSFREFHDAYLTASFRKLITRYQKLLKSKHPLALLQAKKYFEAHYLTLKPLLNQELGLVEITGYYVLLQNFLDAANLYLEQYVNVDRISDLSLTMEALIQHLEHYSGDGNDLSTNA